MFGFGFDMSPFELLPDDDEAHALLEPPAPAYSSGTVRRAFVVWLHCGQQNHFKDVCNYYHYLETMEESLPETKRVSSRLHEFNLLTDMPPYSYFLHRLFPKLYQPSRIDAVNLKKVEEMKLEDCVFNLEGFHHMKKQKGVTPNEIIKTSQIIRKHCITHSKSLRRFLAEFQDFAKKCQIVNSVNNVLVYIRKKNVKDEIETWKRLPRHFSFLDMEVSKEELKRNVVDNVKSDKPVNKAPVFIRDKNASIPKQNNLRILINDSRRKELMNLIPHFSNMSLKENEKNESKTLC